MSQLDRKHSNRSFSSIYVSDITLTDKPAYLEYLQEKQIYDQTLAIPFPYTETDADWWMGHVAETTKNMAALAGQ